MPPGERRGKQGIRYKGSERYNPDSGPCMCLSPRQHKKIHLVFDNDYEAKQTSKMWKYADASDAAADSVEQALKMRPGCTKGCIKAQLDAHHEKMGINKSTDLRASKYGKAPIDIVPASNTTKGFSL
jgi:hypothetical protein